MKITMPDGERWVRVRDKKQRFKAGERRALYAAYDEMTGGTATKELNLMRHMLAHLIEDWSLELPRPGVDTSNGYSSLVYRNLDSLDEIDTDLENELIAEAAGWLKQVAINFGPSKDMESPTKPSTG